MVLVTCISNIDFVSWKPDDDAKMVNVVVLSVCPEDRISSDTESIDF